MLPDLSAGFGAQALLSNCGRGTPHFFYFMNTDRHLFFTMVRLSGVVPAFMQQPLALADEVIE